MNIKKIDKENFYLLENILQEQQLFHYNLDKENNSRFLNIHLKEFTEYMTCEDDYICYAVFNEDVVSGFIACTITDNIAFIEDLFVLDSYRDKG